MRIFLIAAIALILSACVPVEAAEPVKVTTYISEIEMCSAQPFVPGCTPSESNVGNPATYEDIVYWDKIARQNFVYASDKEVFGVEDAERSFAARALKGLVWKGDCDDLANTVIDLLVRAGFPQDKLYRVVVITGKGDVIDHEIALAIDDKGNKWVIGDTGGPTYSFSDIEYKLVQYSQVSNGMYWYNF